MSSNLNTLAREIAGIEGGKVNLPVPQITEVLRCLRVIVSAMSARDAAALFIRLVTPPKPRRTRATKGGAR